ncbi:hypothetical protein H0O00_04135 [Candidatus Micrarchaeota archaeon]|nr:hypothetical protein [Candidatus Micrarchaeota archaeon]
MITSLRKSFNTYSKSPFPFVWASLMYLFVFVATVLACIGLIVVYFICMSILNQPVDPQAIPTLAVASVVALLLLLLLNGLNAALAGGYHAAFWKEKMTLTTFYAYAIDKAPTTFAIMLLRELIWVLLVCPALLVYVYALSSVPYMDLLVGGYVLSMTFVIHMVFTPAFIAAGAFGTDLYNSLKHAFDFLRRRHINFVGQYILFAVVWLVNFIPFLQFVTIFFAYPVVYTAMISMMEDSVKIAKEED